MAWQEIRSDAPLFPGDTIRMTFKTLGTPSSWGGWLQAIDVYFYTRYIESNPNYKIIAYSQPGDSIIFTIKVKEFVGPPQEHTQQASVGTALLIAGTIIGAGLIGYLMLTKVEKMTSTPAGQVVLAGMGVALFAIPIIAIIILLSMTKKTKSAVKSVS
jgi:hypothetical protein